MLNRLISAIDATAIGSMRGLNNYRVPFKLRPKQIATLGASPSVLDNYTTSRSFTMTANRAGDSAPLGYAGSFVGPVRHARSLSPSTNNRSTSSNVRTVCK